MKSSATIARMNDDQLHRLLRANPARIRLKNSFNRTVWTRIEVGESGGCAACVRRFCLALFTWLGRPLPAAMTVASSLALGAWLGNPQDSGGHQERGEISYIESINPLLFKQTGNLP